MTPNTATIFTKVGTLASAAALLVPLLASSPVRAQTADAAVEHQRLTAWVRQTEIAAAIGRKHALAGQLGTGGTPVFVIGERLVPGAIDANQMAEIVAAERAKRQKP